MSQQILEGNIARWTMQSFHTAKLSMREPNCPNHVATTRIEL